MTASSRDSVASGPEGIAVVDKEAGWTSHDVVAKSRGILGTRKVGHSGTLDPDATGVLVLGVGRATRLLRYLQLLPKSYEAEISFGVETSSLDASGAVTATYDMSGLTPDRVLAAAEAFTGTIEQVPPMVSALKVGGRRLYDLARAGVEIERAPREVRVDRFTLTPTADTLVWDAKVDCSSGTYIRSLASDLGKALGGGAHLRALRRTAVGEFTLADARPLEQVELLAMVDGLRGMPTVVVDEATALRITVGSVLDPVALGIGGDGPWGVLGPGGEVLAVYEWHRDGKRVKPSMVLSAP